MQHQTGYCIKFPVFKKNRSFVFWNIFPSHLGLTGVCLLSGTKMAHERMLYLIGHFWSCETLEQMLHQAWVSTRVNLMSLKLRLSGVSLKR